MKVVILAGGMGTRISEESHLKPKPMIGIGEQPIIWHIMKIYSRYGFNEFVICAGYKGFVIKEYFANYRLYESDATFDFSSGGKCTIHGGSTEPWKVTVADTGLETMTGGRIKRIKHYLDDKPFMLTYGDGVADIDINKLLEFHKTHGKPATITAAQPQGRFGALDINSQQQVTAFKEKVRGDEGWINAGFFVLEPSVLDYISGDETLFEKEPLERLAAEGNLCAYKHSGFWQPMDTLRDKHYLETLWKEKRAPWKVW